MNKREPYNMKSYNTDIPDRVADHGIALTQGYCHIHSFFQMLQRRQTAFISKIQQRPKVYATFFISLVGT